MSLRFRVPRVLMGTLIGVAVPVVTMLCIAVGVSEGKQPYDLIRDLFVPLVGPLVAVLIPVVVLFVIPFGQNRQRMALDLCMQYFSEEMRRFSQHRLAPFRDGTTTRTADQTC